MSPLIRYYNLLLLDKKDVLQLFFYAIFAGLISLSLPLGIQAIINFIQSGRVSVSWVVLVFLVVIGVALVGVLSMMQLRITENLQQKIFIRASFEFAGRMPRIKFEELYGTYPPELANRFFDTMSIQKGTSKLLIDFSAALLQIIFGVLLLSLYHPYFIVFGLMLLILLYYIFKYSYNPGLETSLYESKYKYKVAAWLQEMARNNFSFRNELNYDYALQKNDSLVTDYLNYREKHFNVVKRQFTQLIIFKIIITASLLSIGGYLVLSDMELEEESTKEYLSCFTAITLDINNLCFKFPDSEKNIINDINLQINQSEKIFVEGKNSSGKTTLIRLLSGLIQPTSGTFYINDDTFQKIDLKLYRSQIGSIVYGETPFEGSIVDNITFKDSNVTQEDIKWAIETAQLDAFVKTLADGLNTIISPQGSQLSASNAQKILLARSIIHKPKILFYEDPTDTMDENVANEIIDLITAPANKWTIIVSSQNPYWKTKCSRNIVMDNGHIIFDSKN